MIDLLLNSPRLIGQKALKILSCGLLILTVALWSCLIPPGAFASVASERIATPIALASDLSKQPLVEVRVSLGNAANELTFVPSNLELIAGKRYKLLLSNPSSSKHYFTAKDFADSIWTQKVDAGKVEIKGAIRELELKPGGEADWVFVPIKPGSYEFHCAIPGHTEAGMKGIVTVSTGQKSA
jgi:uncharacterized cupredoxin-like copper-binding protein